MEYERFAEPIWIYVGLNVPRSLETVAQAYVFLDECPSTLRGAGYVAAKQLCHEAMLRRAGVDEARRAVVAFAERRGILAPDLTGAIAAREMMVPATRHA